MAKLGVTDKQLKNLKPSNSVINKHFGEGFGVRVHPDGRKIARYSYQIHGRRRVLTLGEYGRGEGMMTCAQLISAHKVASGRRAAGEDPANDRDAAKAEVIEQNQKNAAIQNKLTVRELTRDFEDLYKGLRRGKTPSDRTMAYYTHNISRAIIPKWGDLWVEDLDEVAISRWLERMAKDSPAKAVAVHSTLSVIFTWAKKTKRMKIPNPLADTEKPAVLVSKDRALDYDPELRIVDSNGAELKQFWIGIGYIKNPLYIAALKLILLSGKRPSEVLNARRSHLIDGVWIIPVSNSKNRQGAPRVPITPMIQEVFDSLPEGDVLFPNSKGQPINATRIGIALKKALELTDSPLYGMTAFTPHDLRRTCATHLGDIGYTLEEIKSILDHSTSNNVTSIYVRSDNIDKRRTMLESWQNRLQKILTGKADNNISQLRA